MLKGQQCMELVYRVKFDASVAHGGALARLLIFSAMQVDFIV